MPKVDWNRIYTGKNDDEKATVVKSLGGINLYARSEGALKRAIDSGCRVINKCLGKKITSSRKSLLELVVSKYCQEIDGRIFSALLGRCLSLGQIAAFRCRSIKYDEWIEYSFFVQNSRLTEFNKIKRLFIDQLHSGKLLIPSIVASEYDLTYESSYHILFHLVYCGLAIYHWKSSFIYWPKELSDAINNNKH